MQMGYAPEDWEGRPVIAILNTWSDAQPCHAHFKHRVDGAVLMGGRDFDFLEKGFGPATGEPDIY